MNAESVRRAGRVPTALGAGPFGEHMSKRRLDAGDRLPQVPDIFAELSDFSAELSDFRVDLLAQLADFRVEFVAEFPDLAADGEHVLPMVVTKLADLVADRVSIGRGAALTGVDERSEGDPDTDHGPVRSPARRRATGSSGAIVLGHRLLPGSMAEGSALAHPGVPSDPGSAKHAGLAPGSAPEGKTSGWPRRSEATRRRIGFVRPGQARRRCYGRPRARASARKPS